MLEMSRFERSSGSQTNGEEPQNDTISRGGEVKCLWDPIKVSVVFVVCLMGAVLFSVLKHPSSGNGLWTAPVDMKPSKKATNSYIFSLIFSSLEVGYNFTQPVDPPLKDKLLGGLLSIGLDEKLCLSRYQSVFYHKQQTNLPSSHLISKLRNYEALHKQCGPYTKSYNRTTEYLKSGPYNNVTDCNYVVWIGLNGLGNKMISLASAFMYALLTNRVLLVHPREYIPDLFCEPFSWLLPSDFPVIDEFRLFTSKYPNSYGNMLKRNGFGNSTAYYSLPQFLYLHLAHDYDDYDQLFFCAQEQTFLQKIPWLIIQSNQYFIPALFSIQSFEEELSNLFPDKSTVFHFLGRYLFHPTNTVWGLITKYYDDYLARADEKIGIQIRYVVKTPEAFKQYLDQILACATKENLLPQINENETIINIPPGKPTTKAVLITSLSSRYSEEIRNMYDQEHPAMVGEVIKVFQPSHEEYQQTEDKMHNMKAWEEIYLLSLTDTLVISSTSTFGYVAQSLGGLKPWIIPKPQEYWSPYSPCKRAISMEPCFHFPPSLNCKIKGPIDDLGKLVSHVRNCEDWNRGIKLVDEEES